MHGEDSGLVTSVGVVTAAGPVTAAGLVTTAGAKWCMVTAAVAKWCMVTAAGAKWCMVIVPVRFSENQNSKHFPPVFLLNGNGYFGGNLCCCLRIYKAGAALYTSW